jgi:hypothetical protein
MFNNDKRINMALKSTKNIPQKRMSNVNVRSNIIKDKDIKIKTITKSRGINKEKLLNELRLKTEEKKK